ncbi:MAG: AMP-binding protein, partial [Peptococcaceae bacterium]|nr:AMP-binding protein [Peptococcaceae bacterium]
MRIYEQFYNETFDAAGKLVDIDIHYPDNFNFGYDVVDAIAAHTPAARALVWCNTEDEEHIFTFADISRASNRAANVFLAAGIGRGDRVILALKRHYEYWMAAIALHKIGAVMIPVTHMLTTDDLVYRIQASGAKAIFCTAQNGVPERVRAAVAQSGATCRLWSTVGELEGFADFGAAMKAASEELARQETRATDPMVIYFTSGTSGYPKGVIHDFTYPLAHYVTAKYWQGVKAGGLHFTVSETGWAKASWGKLYGQWLNECAVMVYDFDNFEPKQMAAIINRYGVTSFCAPPTIYRY